MKELMASVYVKRARKGLPSFLVDVCRGRVLQGDRGHSGSDIFNSSGRGFCMLGVGFRWRQVDVLGSHAGKRAG